MKYNELLSNDLIIISHDMISNNTLYRKIQRLRSPKNHLETMRFNPLIANPTKWSNSL